MTTQLSEHFTLEEMIASDTADRLGIDNTPSETNQLNLAWTCDELEGVRELLGKRPIIINSGYRCPDLNKAVGGSSSSDHMKGFAVDFTCPEYGTPLEICQIIMDSNLRFSQLIYEYTWVHIAFVPIDMGKLVVMTKQKNGYFPGLVVV